MSDFIAGKDIDELTLVIANKEIIIESGKLLKTMDTGCDAFTCVMPWEPGLDPKLDEITAPYSYSQAMIYIAGELQMTGILYNVNQRQSNNGTIKELEIYSQISDMIDSNWQPPFEENNIDIEQICKNQASQFGIDVVLDTGVEKGGKFSRVSVNQTDKCFDQLAKLAAQRGLLLSCTKYGELLIVKPNVNGQPIGTLFSENPYTEIYEAKYTGRNRFYKYSALTSSASTTRTQSKKIALDTAIPVTRFLTFKADESLPGEGLNAAEYRRNKTAAESMDISWPVNTWYAPNGSLWQPNTQITIKNPVISENGFTFLINQVEFDYTVKGTTVMLGLKPPLMYQIGDIEEPEWN